MPAFLNGDAVVFNAGDPARTEPFDIADIGHFNSGLDAVLKNLEPYGPGRHGSYIKYCKYIDILSHFSEYIVLSDIASRYLYNTRTTVRKQ